MKKLVLMLAVVFSVSLFSCGNGEKGSAKDTCDTCDTAAQVENVEVSASIENVVLEEEPVATDASASVEASASEAK